MISASLRHFRTPNTNLYLNGPILQIVKNPSSVTVQGGTTVVLSGFTTATFEQNPTAILDGEVTYRWYHVETSTPVLEGTKYVGTATSQLTINNPVSPDDNLDKFYFESGYTPSAELDGYLNDPTSGNATNE
jgi:hypothetical protein